MNITIARPRCRETIFAVVFDGVNTTRFNEWPISISSSSGDLTYSSERGKIDLSGDYILLVHFFTVDESDVIGTIVLPAERLRQLSISDTQRIWMAIGDKFIYELPARTEAIKYFDRLISADVAEAVMKLPILFSYDTKWIPGCSEATPIDRPTHIVRRTLSSEYFEHGETVAAAPVYNSPQKSPPREECPAPADRALCRARNRSISRYCELGQGVTALRCFLAWSAFWLEEKRGLQAMQLYSELETKRTALESQTMFHAEAIEQAVAHTSERYTSLFNRWKARVEKRWIHDQWWWMREIFTSWRRESRADSNSYRGTICRRWFLLACQLARFSTNQTSSRLHRIASKLSQCNVRNLVVAYTVFRAWHHVLTRRRRFLAGVDALATSHQRHANRIRAWHCFSVWCDVLTEVRNVRELAKDRRRVLGARRKRAESIDRIFSERDQTHRVLVFVAWRSRCAYTIVGKLVESANSSCESARREAEKAMVDKQALGEKLASMEKEMGAVQQLLDSTVEFRDQQYKLLHDMYQNVTSELDELKTADAALEELRRTSLSDKLRLQSTVEELTSVLEEANSDKEKAQGRTQEVESELEEILKEVDASQKQAKDIEKRLERERRQHVQQRQESKNSLAEKVLEIERLHSLREKESLTAKVRLQKGAMQSRTLQKKLVSNESQAAQLACLDTEKAQLERKVTLLEKEQRRTVAMQSQKDRELVALRKELDSMKALVPRAKSSGERIPQAKVKQRKDFVPLPRKRADSLSLKEMEEFEGLKEAMDAFERENEILTFECGREELMQQCKAQEIEIMQTELEKGLKRRRS